MTWSDQVWIGFFANLPNTLLAIAAIITAFRMLGKKMDKTAEKLDINTALTTVAANKSSAAVFEAHALAIQAKASNQEIVSKVEDTHQLINSRLDEMMKNAKEAAHAEGKAEGSAEKEHGT